MPTDAPEAPTDLPTLARDTVEHLNHSRLDEVEPVAVVALLEDRLPRLEVLASDGHGSVRLELDDIRRQEEIERPVHGHADLPIEPRQLHQVHRAPEPPGEKAGELEPKHLGDRRAVTQRSHLAESLEGKSALRRAPQACRA